MDLVSDVIGFTGILVQLVLLFLLIRGPFRRYFLIFAYCLAQTAQTVADGAPVTSLHVVQPSSPR